MCTLLTLIYAAVLRGGVSAWLISSLFFFFSSSGLDSRLLGLLLGLFKAYRLNGYIDCGNGKAGHGLYCVLYAVLDIGANLMQLEAVFDYHVKLDGNKIFVNIDPYALCNALFYC